MQRARHEASPWPLACPGRSRKRPSAGGRALMGRQSDGAETLKNTRHIYVHALVHMEDSIQVSAKRAVNSDPLTRRARCGVEIAPRAIREGARFVSAFHFFVCCPQPVARRETRSKSSRGDSMPEANVVRNSPSYLFFSASQCATWFAAETNENVEKIA